MKKVIIMLFIASLWGSLFAQQGLDIEYIDKELSPKINKYTELEMNLVDHFHYRYPSKIIGLTFDGEYLWFSDVTHDSIIAVEKIQAKR